MTTNQLSMHEAALMPAFGAELPDTGSTVTSTVSGDLIILDPRLDSIQYDAASAERAVGASVQRHASKSWFSRAWESASGGLKAAGEWVFKRDKVAYAVGAVAAYNMVQEGQETGKALDADSASLFGKTIDITLELIGNTQASGHAFNTGILALLSTSAVVLGLAMRKRMPKANNRPAGEVGLRDIVANRQQRDTFADTFEAYRLYCQDTLDQISAELAAVRGPMESEGAYAVAST